MRPQARYFAGQITYAEFQIPMKVFAISDLHLGSNVDKPMDIFGPEWEGHTGKIAAGWRETVGEGDLVLLPGDLSWAMKLEDALEDLKLIDSLPGRKVFIRGNHDFWFSAPSKVRRVLGESMEPVRFGACVYGGVGICGVRGWSWPGCVEYDEEKDSRYYRRELERLRLSLASLSGLQWQKACAMMHYPPVVPGCRSEFSTMIRDAGIKWTVYGHIHGPAAGRIVDQEVEGVNYVCVSADIIGFRPKFLFEI